MKNYISTFVLICFGFLLLNCNKQHKDLQVVNLDVDSFVLRYLNFKPGSYWIYKDSLSGRVDSFFVSGNFYSKQGAENAIYNYHYVVISEYNMDGTAVADSARWQFNYQDKKIILDYFYGQNSYGWKYDVTYSPLYIFPFQMGDNHSTFDTATVVGIDSFYASNGLPFYNVAHMHQYIHVDSNTVRGLTTIDDHFFLNDSVGMIKMRVNHPQDSALHHVWELQRYNISKF
jgi:hypothetical protein